MRHHREESPSHYFLYCFLYLPGRQTPFDQIEHNIPRFKTFTKCKKLDIILKGIDIENNDLIRTNTTLTIAVQNCPTRPPSWNLSLAEILANLSLQDRATEWHYNHSSPPPTTRSHGF